MKFKEIILLTISALGFAASINYLMTYDQKNHQKKSGRSDKERLGVVNKKFNSLKIKSSDSLTWVDADNTDSIFLNDKIFTAADSSASLDIKNSSLIEMSSMTLLQFEKTTTDKMNLNVEQGSLFIDLASHNTIGEIKVGTNTLKANQTKAKLQIEMKPEMSVVNLYDGEMEIKVGKKAVHLKADEILSINPQTGDYKQQPADFRLQTPTPGEKIILGKNTSIEFSWLGLTPEAKLSPITLEIADDSEFKHLQLTENLEPNQVDRSLTLNKPGEYYWRVRMRDGTTILPHHQKFTLIPAAPVAPGVSSPDPKLLAIPVVIAAATPEIPKPKITEINPLTPKPYQTLTRLYPNQAIKLSWETISSGPASDFLYTLEIAHDESFQKIIKTATVSTSNFSWAATNDGQFFWRVKSNDITTSAQNFTIRTLPSLEAPVLEESYTIQLQEEAEAFFKLQSEFWVASNSELTGFVSDPTKKYFAKLSWPAMPLAKTYILEIYLDAEAKNLFLQQHQIPTNSFVWRSPDAGSYFFRIAYKDQYGRLSPYSRLSSLEIEVFGGKNPEVAEVSTESQVPLPVKTNFHPGIVKARFDAGQMKFKMKALKTTYESDQKYNFNLYNSFDLSAGAKYADNKFIEGFFTGKFLSNTDSTLRVFELGGYFSWYWQASQDFLIYYGPGVKFSRQNFSQTTSATTAQAGLDFLSMLGKVTVVFPFFGEHTKQIINTDLALSIMAVNYKQVMLDYALRYDQLPFFKDGFIQIGAGYIHSTAKNENYSTQTNEIRIPLTIGIKSD